MDEYAPTSPELSTVETCQVKGKERNGKRINKYMPFILFFLSAFFEFFFRNFSLTKMKFIFIILSIMEKEELNAEEELTILQKDCVRSLLPRLLEDEQFLDEVSKIVNEATKRLKKVG